MLLYTYTHLVFPNICIQPRLSERQVCDVLEEVDIICQYGVMCWYSHEVFLELGIKRVLDDTCLLLHTLEGHDHIRVT